MKKTIRNFVSLGLVLLALSTTSTAQDLYVADTTFIKFFSEAPLENITADNTKSQGLLNVSTGKVAVVVPIVEFHFEKPLMEEHFNENYMESNKYKTGTFQGKVNEDIDLSKDGEYKASATGPLKIHGVTQERTLNGTITVKGDRITLDSKFEVKLEDHDIEIPRMVIENIAEVIEVTVHLEFIPKAKTE